ncbi:hypothetical protein pb186bvf_009514 [Paramecium bursaria]
MSDDDDWEKWADDEKKQEQTQEEPKGEPQQEIKQSQPQKKDDQQKSMEADMNNIIDMFGGEKAVKKFGQQDLKKIGDNFGAALQNVGPFYTTEFLRNLILKLENKLVLENWEELHKIVDTIYQKKKKLQQEHEERINKNKKGAPVNVKCRSR